MAKILIENHAAHNDVMQISIDGYAHVDLRDTDDRTALSEAARVLGTTAW